MFVMCRQSSLYNKRMQHSITIYNIEQFESLLSEKVILKKQRKILRFGHTYKWYLHTPESIQEKKDAFY